MNAVVPVTTALYAAILGLLAAWLTINVILNRVRSGIDTADGGDARLAQVIRAHANFAEQVPLILILMALAEVLGARGLVLQIIGIALLAARFASAYALSRSLGQTPLRQLGGGLTIVVIVVASVTLLLAYFGVR